MDQRLKEGRGKYIHLSLPIILWLWSLIEHRVETRKNLPVTLDKFLEFLYHWVQGLAVYALGLARLKDSAVGREIIA